jgi:hypothetical protein
MGGGHKLVGHLITEDSENAQCTFSASVVLRHTVPPLKKNCQIGEKITTKTGSKSKSHTGQGAWGG